MQFSIESLIVVALMIRDQYNCVIGNCNANAEHEEYVEAPFGAFLLARQKSHRNQGNMSGEGCG